MPKSDKVKDVKKVKEDKKDGKVKEGKKIKKVKEDKPDKKPKEDKKVTPLVKVPISSKEILAKAAKKLSQSKPSSKDANGKLKKADKVKESSEESSESSSEDEKPKAAQLKPAPAKLTLSSESSDSSSEDDVEKSTSNATVKVVSKKAPAQKKNASSSEESNSDKESTPAKPSPTKVVPTKQGKSDSSDESESDDDVPPPKAAPAKSAAPAKDDSSDDSSDSDDDAPPVKGAKPSPTKVVLVAKQATSEESDDSESDDDAPPSKTAKDTRQVAPKKAAAVESDYSSDDSSDDEKAKPAEKGVLSSESDSEEEDGDVKMADAAPMTNGSNKRKATDDTQPQAKKVKFDEDTPEESKTIFVGRLSWSVDNDRLAQEFAHCGEVESANVQMDRDSGKSRGFGYVRFTTSEAVEKALLMNGQEIDGRAVNIDRSTAPDKGQAREKRAKAFGDQTSPPSSTLFVGNLSFDVTEDTVWSFFNDYGVKSVRLPTDRDTGRPKGFGYVEFEDVDGAKKAFEAANGADIEGRSIRLDYSQPRDSSGGGRSGGRGFGDRGGRGGGRGFGDRGGRGGGRGGRGGFGDRGGRGGGRGGDRGGRGRGGPRGMSKNGGIAAFEGKKITF